MRPEQQTTILEKSPRHLAVLKQTTILNILNVFIMMRMTYTSLWNIYENVDMSTLWSIWSPWWNEKGATAAKQKWCHGNISENDATATYPKMMPRQHIGSGSSPRYQCKGSGRERVMQDGGVIPDSGFPRDGGMAKEGHRKDNSFMVQNSSISYNTCIRSRAVISGLYLRSVHFGAVQNRRGK